MKVLGWYVVDRKDYAMRCADEEDATRVVSSCDRHFHNSAPHRAVLLAEIDESEIPTMGE